ncbi:MAG: fluoride efflux transporter CrcB [Rubrobacteraceae bacterium]
MGVIYVAVGGAIGASARYLVSNWMSSWLGTDFPWGTFFANISGSFLIGIVLVLVEGGSLPAEARLLLAVGILGGYTTFSSFSYESLQLITGGAIFATFLNMFGQLALGLAFVYLGVVVGRLIGGM